LFNSYSNFKTGCWKWS